MGKKLKKSEVQYTEPADISGLDERSMIREQDRLAREKKKRKNRKKKRISGAVVLVLMAGGIWYFIWGRTLFAQEEETTVKITASAGQEIQYVKLTSVKGNEITYMLAEEAEENEGQAAAPDGGGMPGSVSSAEGGMPSGSGHGRYGEGATGNGERPEGTMSESGMPAAGEGQQDAAGMSSGSALQGTEGNKWEEHGNQEGADGISMSEEASNGSAGAARIQLSEGNGEASWGERPDRNGSTGVPSGGMPDMSQMGGSSMFGGQSGTNTFTYNGITYRLTDQTVTARIPVGTEVTTKLGTVTTFSRLAAGDCVALVTEMSGEEQIIAAVYIIG